MTDDQECCVDLLLAVIRLAVCDLLGLRYGHDEPVSMQPLRRAPSGRRESASAFLDSPWADHLAELCGMSGDAVRAELRRLHSHAYERKWDSQHRVFGYPVATLGHKTVALTRRRKSILGARGQLSLGGGLPLQPGRSTSSR